MSRSERILLYISYAMFIILFSALVTAIFTKQWYILFPISLALILFFLPNYVERTWKVNLPIELEVIMIFFIFGTIFLGEVRDFYARYWWWDIMLHTLSGVILAIIAFVMIYQLSKGKKINISLNTNFIAFFAFLFAVALGAVWEIFEFSMDMIFGLSMQKGLQDTMTDLIVDSLGALIVSLTGYFYLKKKRISIIERLVKKFIRENK